MEEEEAIQRKIMKEKNTLVRLWATDFVKHFEKYKNSLYFAEVDRTQILRKIERDIIGKYALKRKKLLEALESTMRETQKSKSDMATMTITGFQMTRRYHLADPEFCFQYTTPEVVPPSFSLKFISINLPSSTEEMTVSNMKNMEFEMPQSDTLLLHANMNNGETIMFIRHDDPEGNKNKNHTKVYVSRSRVLRKDDDPLKTIKRMVQLVAYCEAQKLFAVLTGNELVFYIYQEGGRLPVSNRRSDLREYSWWNSKLQFKAMLMEEVNKNVWLWLIDQNNIVRAFDYEAGSWDSSKQFNLGQDFESFQMMSMGYFVIALKPQYEVGQLQDTKPMDVGQDLQQKLGDEANPNEEATELTKEDKESADGIDENDVVGVKTKVPTGRIELHAFYLMKKKKLEYVVHKSSTTGYETGNEREYKEGDDKKDDLKVVDHILLPEAFTTINDHVSCSRILAMESNKKDDILLCAITGNMELLYHPMTVFVSEARMTISTDKKTETIRKITKMDYMEYMIEKFG